MKYLTIFIALLSLLAPSKLFAARIFAEIYNAPARVGDEIEIAVFVDSEGKNLNAFESKIEFDARFDAIHVRDNASIVTIWVEKPHVSGKTIPFSGFTPGGFDGNRGELFRVRGNAREIGTSFFKFIGTKMYLSDGNGTSDSVFESALSFEIDESKGEPSRISESADTIRPEPFEVVISRDANSFEGRYFATFYANDKQTSVGRYEVAEPRLPWGRKNWRTATSPYVLEDQSGNSWVFVKAWDESGNWRVSSAKPVKWIFQYLILSASIIIILILCTLLFLRRKGKHRRAHSR